MLIDDVFRLANTCALISWVALIVLPWRVRVSAAIQVVTVGGLCLLYGGLVMAFFFTVPGGGFSSLAAVQRLFTVPEVALAGWIHYLAFDLFIGLWIAGRYDALGISRWLQAPVLVVTFMFGPLGLLLYFSSAWIRQRAAEAST
jgi:Domain of unknown function (DUF4281)